GQEREYRYSWKRQNWFDNQREEHLAVRDGVGLFDMTSFGKIRVEGRDACALLQRLCANDMNVAPGKIVYTQMLNAKGGIESDLTVTRLSETAYFLVVPGATLQRDLAWLRRHVADEFVVITDVTAAEAVLCLMGPESRKLIQKVSPNDFSNEGNPFGTFHEIEIGMGLARAHRVTYVGELGWELYVSTEQAAHVFEAISDAGEEVGLKLCGLHTLDSCRIEKAFRHFGHDITDEDNVLEAGLGFAVKTSKADFIGRDAVLRKKEAGLDRRLVQFRLKDPRPLLFHNEAILRDGKIVGPITSGNYGHHLGGAIGLGYVPCQGESGADVLASSYEVEIAGERFVAEASLKPMYDPKAERVRM
ncbi:aminomethyltransferase family protein, partial [Mesorhizobium sp.]|uniref:aminomethyltransferase family protein n=1 Tax=Mesorhizobium sp. TaxID=1871066 RepID=UPI0025F360AB